MNFLKNFFTSVAKSVKDPRWIREQKGEGGKPWMYYVFFMLVTTAVLTISSMLWIVPRETNQLWEIFRAEVPDFQATMSSSTLNISNIDQPYAKVITDNNGETLGVYIDTMSTGSLSITEAFDGQVDAALFVFSDHLEAYERGIRVHDPVLYSEMEIEDFESNREELIQNIDEILGNVLPFLIPIAAIFFWIVWMIAKLVWTLFLSFVVWVITKIASRPEWTFKNVINIALYSLTAPTLLFVLLVWMDVRAPFVYSLVLLGYMLFVIFGDDREDVTEKKES